MLNQRTKSLIWGNVEGAPHEHSQDWSPWILFAFSTTHTCQTVPQLSLRCGRPMTITDKKMRGELGRHRKNSTWRNIRYGLMARCPWSSYAILERWSFYLKLGCRQGCELEKFVLFRTCFWLLGLFARLSNSNCCGVPRRVMRVMRQVKGVVRPKVVCLAYTSLALLDSIERPLDAIWTDAFATM